MLKKIFFFTLFTIASVHGSTLDILQAQRKHIINQMSVIKKSWNIERLHIKMAKQASLSLYETVQPILEKILSQSDVTSKIETDVALQVNAIVNDNASFVGIKNDYKLSDFSLNIALHDYGQKLFSAMANKTAYIILGQKLTQKIAEIDLAMSMAQQSIDPYNG